MMTAKEICEEVYGLSGFESLGAFRTSPDPDDRMIFFLLRQAVRDVGKYKWQKLVKTGRITNIGNEPSFALPPDFREFIPGSIFAFDDTRVIDLPTNFSKWGRIESGVGPIGIEHRFQLRDDMLQRLDVNSPVDIRFDYISDHPVETAEGVTAKRLENDSDLVLLDEDLMIKALKAKWSLEKGLDTFQMDAMAFDTYLKDLRGTDMASKKLRFVYPRDWYPASPYTNRWV